MNLVEVATTKPYRVRIGSGAVHELAGLVAGRRAAVVCPQTLVHLVPRFGIDDLVVIEVPDAEAAKKDFGERAKAILDLKIVGEIGRAHV